MELSASREFDFSLLDGNKCHFFIKCFRGGDWLEFSLIIDY